MTEARVSTQSRRPFRTYPDPRGTQKRGNSGFRLCLGGEGLCGKRSSQAALLGLGAILLELRLGQGWALRGVTEPRRVCAAPSIAGDGDDPVQDRRDAPGAVRTVVMRSLERNPEAPAGCLRHPRWRGKTLRDAEERGGTAQQGRCSSQPRRGMLKRRCPPRTR